MEAWFTALTLFEKIYWITAIVATIVMVIFILLMFLGGDADGIDGDVDAEIDADTGVDFQFLSFKNLSGFFAIFGWAGIASMDAGLGKAATIGISVLCGLLMMFAMASLFYYLGKLQSSGTLHLKNALNLIGEVYLTIGADRASIGK